MVGLNDHSSVPRDDRCTFDTRRLRPGVLFTAIRGHDAGQFGDKSFEVVELEHARFLTRVHWFIDARNVDGVSGGVLERWTQWLAGKPHCLARVDVLTSTRAMNVNIALTSHLAGAQDVVQLHGEARSFEASLLRAGVSSEECSDHLQTASGEIARLTSGGFEVRGRNLRYRFEQPDALTVHTVVAGREEGQLGDAVMDAFASLLDKNSGRFTWQLDLRGVSHVAPWRARAWSAWILAREARFARIAVFAPAPAIAMFLLDTKYRLRQPGLMAVVRHSSNE